MHLNKRNRDVSDDAVHAVRFRVRITSDRAHSESWNVFFQRGNDAYQPYKQVLSF